ncbi:DsbC family protein [Aliikangiella sp. IMCC44653]
MSLVQKLLFVFILAVAVGALFLGVHSQQLLATSQGNQSNVTQVSSAQKPIGQDLGQQALIAKLEAKLPGLEIADMTQSPVEGFYQAYYAGQLLYVSADGQFIFTGILMELAEDAPINHGQIAIAQFEARKAPMRAAEIKALNEQDMVVFKAENEQHVITVFTDVDCGYCRKFHRDMQALNSQGVTVRYLAYPRAGIGSSAYDKLVSVWCADDKTSAMDNAKLRREFTDKTCTNPVASHYALTQKLALSGTPMIILDDGELIGGYMPANDLVKHLNQKLQNNRQANGTAR